MEKAVFDVGNKTLTFEFEGDERVIQIQESLESDHWGSFEVCGEFFDWNLWFDEFKPGVGSFQFSVYDLKDDGEGSLTVGDVIESYEVEAINYDGDLETAVFGTVIKEETKTVKSTVEKNRLIAEFMGYTTREGYPDEYYSRDDYYMGSINQCMYHSSWEELMPVVLEISLRNKTDKRFMGVFTLHNLGRTIIQCYKDERLVKTIEVSGVSGIKPTYDAVCEYMEWYNSNK